MIYPTISFTEENNNYTSAKIQVYDTDWERPQDSILTFYDAQDSTIATESFLLLTQAFLNQLSTGYDMGYADAVDDMETEEELEFNDDIDDDNIEFITS